MPANSAVDLVLSFSKTIIYVPTKWINVPTLSLVMNGI